MDADEERRNAAISELPDALAAVVREWFDRYDEQALPPLPGDLVAGVVRLVAASEFAAATLLAEAAELIGERGIVAHPQSALDRFAVAIADADSIDAFRRSIRRFRRRYLAQVLWREITGASTLDETLSLLSRLADRMIGFATERAEAELAARFGHVLDADGDRVPLVVVGMGKLGGGELNFSSDVDLVFLYPRDGDSDGARCLSAPEYFARLARKVIQLLDDVTADGFVFRVDIRLRPFGDSGPAVVSFAALERYLLQHGRDWERYAWVKARIVGRQPPEDVSDALFKDLVEPFVYRRYLDYGVFESLRDMHSMIRAEVGRRELADSVKLGPGGIREIEFIVQSLQLVRGGNQPELVEPSLRRVLPRLVDARGLDAATADELDAAYVFLRRLENFIQALRDQQTHDLPPRKLDRARLAFATGHGDWEALCAELAGHRANVTRHFESVAFRDADSDANARMLERVATAWAGTADADEWTALLDEYGFADAGRVATAIVRFRDAPSTRKVDTITAKRLAAFVGRLAALTRQREDPYTAVARVSAVLGAVLRRSAYIALLNENPLAAERLVGFCERSGWIAGQIERFPALLDELLDPAADPARFTRQSFAEELSNRLGRYPDDDTESRTEALALSQRSIMFRIAVADFGDDLPIMKVSDSLTYLAEVVVAEALDMAWRDVTVRHGAPCYVVDGETHEASFAVIGYGKLGGLELSYGSDLDLVFLHDSRGDSQATDGNKPIDNAVFFARLVRRLVHILTTRTSSGVLYEVDTRLRPSGQSGLLVSGVAAFERYQEDNAWTWEHQALLRARPIAGGAALCREFDRIRAETLKYRVRRDSLAKDVVGMRMRMRQELDQSDAAVFDLKQGEGGIGDIEFLVQYLVLWHAADAPAVFHYSDNIRQLEALAAERRLDAADADELADIYRRYRLRVHHLVLNARPALVDAAEFTEERERVATLWRAVFA